MSDTSKFLADIQRIKKHVRADNGGKYDGRKVCEQISSLFASSNRNAGDLARSIADYWLNSYIFASADLLQQIVKLHGYNTICAPIFSQYAAVEGLRHGWKDVEKMRISYQQRRNLMYKAFCDMGLPVPEPKGAFYMFPDISSIPSVPLAGRAVASCRSL